MIAGFIPHHRRRDPGRRPAGEGTGPRPRRGVPVVRAVSLAHRAGQRRLRSQDARRRQGRAREDRARVPGARQAVGGGGALSQRAVGRHAAARRRGARAGQRAGRAADGRALRQRRCADAHDPAGGTDPHLAGEAAHRHLHYPRCREKPFFSPIAWWRCPRGACWRRSPSTCRGPRSWDALNEDDAVQGADRRAFCNSCGRPEPCWATPSGRERRTCCWRSRAAISRGSFG